MASLKQPYADSRANEQGALKVYAEGLHMGSFAAAEAQGLGDDVRAELRNLERRYVWPLLGIFLVAISLVFVRPPASLALRMAILLTLVVLAGYFGACAVIGGLRVARRSRRNVRAY